MIVIAQHAPEEAVPVAPSAAAAAVGDAVLAASGVEQVLCFAAGLDYAGRRRLALADLAEAWRLWRLVRALAWLDIKARYRGSVLGPFWLTLSTAVMVFALGILYSTLFRMDLHTYLPFLGLSLVLWNLLQSLVTDGCIGFTVEEATIRSVRMPFSLYAARIVLRNLIVFAHNIAVVVVVFAVFGIWPGLGLLAAVPALALWLIDAFALTLTLGAICARFRDIPPIVASVMQIAFFVSPIIWKPELMRDQAGWLPLNPFYALFEIVRGPLLGTGASALLWGAAVAYSVLLLTISWRLFVRVRGRLAFWV